jgi:biopolymer transport protein TolR
MAFTTPQGRTATSLSEINVTPLVDVMLVLLVIFMVTAPILQVGVDVQLPDTRNVQEYAQNETIVLSITREGLIYYKSEAINFSTIAEHLRRDVRSPKDEIYLRADKDVKWNSIVSVIDAIRGAGFKEVRLITRPFREPRRR